MGRQECQEDRRRQVMGAMDVGSYTPGIARVERHALERIRAHDDMWRNNPDSQTWQTEYSLEDHCVRLAMVMLAIGKARKREEKHVDLGQSAGLVHDIGKVDPECWCYRKNGLLTPDERSQLIRRHMQVAEGMLKECEKLVRFSDHVFLEELRIIVGHHHTPWEIEDPILREIGIDLWLADFFVGRQESRHKPGLSQFQALDKLADFVSERAKAPECQPIQGLMFLTLGTIDRLYGRDVENIIAQAG